ncbi:MAG: haloacid dehalogenase type II [Proteobacteria bacterium]|nr:haloacid dehalogenase type II [Pseudomonadota bacterium]MDA1024006.1 haloacid dehalogenase type II [Pseudomonadota bacterium]
MPYKLITFDAYMGLMDIQGSIVPVLAKALGVDDATADPLVRTWRATQMARAAASNSLGLGRTSFRACTRLGLDYVLVRQNINLDDDARTTLVDAWDRMNPWPDGPGIIAAIKQRGYLTAILSNGDQDQLDAINQNAFNSIFDHVLSSESCGYYKPHPSVYELPTKVLGIAKEDVLHVAGSPGDVLGAEAFGMTCYWSNRTGDLVPDPAFPASYERSDLAGLLDIL